MSKFHPKNFGISDAFIAATKGTMEKMPEDKPETVEPLDAKPLEETIYDDGKKNRKALMHKHLADRLKGMAHGTKAPLLAKMYLRAHHVQLRKEKEADNKKIHANEETIAEGTSLYRRDINNALKYEKAGNMKKVAEYSKKASMSFLALRSHEIPRHLDSHVQHMRLKQLLAQPAVNEAKLNEGSDKHVHVHLHPEGKKRNGLPLYKIHSLGKGVSGLEHGEEVTDSDLDDISEMGYKVKTTKAPK